MPRARRSPQGCSGSLFKALPPSVAVAAPLSWGKHGPARWGGCADGGALGCPRSLPVRWELVRVCGFCLGRWVFNMPGSVKRRFFCLGVF